eukprot:TRINITY_DN56758_c0_g1_i2.p1 TRINITY_DN56758_c0_g1~~TRINITY_DN56758_c0_g1_i2.p1  ORF type:complete len:225 (-),score=41.89 TRINITY_DN56758_c0_g1_i2:169-843(-)
MCIRDSINAEYGGDTSEQMGSVLWSGDRPQPLQEQSSSGQQHTLWIQGQRPPESCSSAAVWPGEKPGASDWVDISGIGLGAQTGAWARGIPPQAWEAFAAQLDTLVASYVSPNGVWVVLIAGMVATTILFIAGAGAVGAGALLGVLAFLMIGFLLYVHWQHQRVDGQVQELCATAGLGTARAEYHRENTGCRVVGNLCAPEKFPRRWVVVQQAQVRAEQYGSAS